MPVTLSRPRAARVLFDEFHSEAWTIRPELAREMQPSHPADVSYERAAAVLAERDFMVASNADGPFTAARLAEADVVVIAHPSDPAWEATTNANPPRLSADEITALERFVHGGGGLIVLGETEQEKYGNNLNELLARFGLHIDNATVQDYEHHHGDAPTWVLADLAPAGRGTQADLLARVHGACFYRAGTLAEPGSGALEGIAPGTGAGNGDGDRAAAPPLAAGATGARVLARTSTTASRPAAALAVAVEHGEGRVVALADSDLFGDDCIGDLDHTDLWLNLLYWAGARAFAAPAGGERPAALAHPDWERLRAATDELALLQAPDGAVQEDASRDAARAHVETMATAIAGLTPLFAHQQDYLAAVRADLRAWVDGGFAKPDFAGALAAFRPERQRQDGIEHLVVFPMYKQNGSRDTCFEALIVRVPWPEWVAELERTRYDNPKFVPVELLGHTRGYDSDCAVLFPETVSVAGKPVNEFGGIFCDREAERFRRVCGAATEILKLNLPPDAACLLTSEALSRDAYILWDLIHDRAHSHGDLPFDPFMIRQRAPYWMYSLEELRCDLTAFGEAVELEAEGFGLARYVQYAILFDRLFRFPITGPRVRNYDGLGGQLLFAHLHKRGLVRWTDNRLTIDWDGVAAGVTALRDDVEELYRAGIDRSKLTHWCAAHDLIAANVAPAAGSAWSREARSFEDVDDPRPYIDLVKPDEFPLSMFYVSLKAKLDPAAA